MQYPIIDTLTKAYINNGWTGLELTEGKNLAYIELIGKCPSISTGNIIDYAPGVSSNLIEIDSSNNYTFTNFSEETVSVCYIFLYDSNNTFIRVMTYFNNSFQISFSPDVSYIRIRLDRTSIDAPIPIIQFEKGTESTQYEPYAPPTTDIFSRTRLPIIRYFPHALIDSLQRANDGTMTADDVQVLRHYLSRFGIGNIELGRFHAINLNTEENKTLEFKDEKIPIEDFPIDEVKKKGDD